MRKVALTAIKAYQRYISPYKGFSCAYRVHTGHSSCSKLGYRAIRRFGVIGGLNLIRQRTNLCGVAYRRFSNNSQLHNQRGFCDADCDLPSDFTCDLPSANCVGMFCDLLSYNGCDWPPKKQVQQEKYVYIPPNSMKREDDWAAVTPLTTTKQNEDGFKPKGRNDDYHQPPPPLHRNVQ